MLKPKPDQIEAWVARHFPTYKRRKNGQELTIANPFDPTGDKGKHFGINTVKAGCHDWRPGHQQADGSFIKFVQLYRGISFHEAIKEVCGDVDLRSLLRVDKDFSAAPPISKIELPDGAESFSSGKSMARTIALNYLESRGIDEKIAVRYDIHHTVTSVVFPYYEYEDMVCWQSRDIITKAYLFPDEKTTGVKKTHYIYGFDHVEPCTEVVVVESIFGVFALGENVVSTGGASMDDMQVRKIRALRPQRVILAPDNDDAGVKSLFSNFFKLEPYFHDNIWFSVPPVGLKVNGGGDLKDWSEIGEKFGWSAPRKVLDASLKKLNQPQLMRVMKPEAFA